MKNLLTYQKTEVENPQIKDQKIELSKARFNKKSKTNQKGIIIQMTIALLKQPKKITIRQVQY